MTVRKDSWHAQLYRWWYRQKYGENPSGNHTNLCPYVRAVLFWCWMRWLFIGGKVVGLRLAYVLYPALIIEVPRWLGIVSYNAKMVLLMLYVIGVAIAAFILACAGIKWLHDQKGFGKKALTEMNEFGALITARGRATHDRICPEITFQ